ncbi:response regulator [candidate division KSB1 bacterium]|nr:response regulator [candidate division KSB1 bacterium]
MKIIIADDSRMVRGIVEKIVGSIGFDAVHAANGKEAMDILRTEHQAIDLVLLDWNMPVLSGMDVIKKMQGEDQFKNIPVLMVSTESETQRIQEALNAGAKGYVTKPFTPEQLIGAIQNVLSIP